LLVTARPAGLPRNAKFPFSPYATALRFPKGRIGMSQSDIQAAREALARLAGQKPSVKKATVRKSSARKSQ
jgi:hypothetical protein